MHLKTLVGRLTRLLGSPVKLEHQQGYRWQITRKGHAAVHLCVELNDCKQHASIWIFDPANPDKVSQCIELQSQDQLGEVLEGLEARIASAHAQREAAGCRHPEHSN